MKKIVPSTCWECSTCCGALLTIESASTVRGNVDAYNLQVDDHTYTVGGVGLLVGVVVIVSALTFFPALTLGPVVEHFLMMRHQLFSLLLIPGWR